MKILVRNSIEKSWEKIESFDYSQEAELQELLAELPELIDITEIREGSAPLLVAVREFGLPGSGHTDLVAFSANGDIAVIECKLAANNEIKRKVIGQVLEYGAYLWKTTYERLDQVVLERNGDRLVDLVLAKVDDPEWDEDAFRQRVRTALENGDFILVIAVDEMNDELSRTIRFMNGCGRPAFAFTALEMRRFQSGGTEILVPHLFGAISTGETKPDRNKRQWDEESFFEKLEDSPGINAAKPAKEILEWAKSKVTKVWWGKGGQKGSFVPVFKYRDVDHLLFAVMTNGKLGLYFQHYAVRPVFDTETKRLELLERLNSIDGITIPEDAIERRPRIVLEDLREGNRVKKFLDVFEWYLEEITRS